MNNYAQYCQNLENNAVDNRDFSNIRRTTDSLDSITNQGYYVIDTDTGIVYDEDIILELFEVVMNQPTEKVLHIEYGSEKYEIKIVNNKIVQYGPEMAEFIECF